MLTDSSELERLSLHYVENFKNVTDSKRYKRMSAVLERAEGTSEEEKTAEEVLEDGLGLLMRAPYSQRLAEMLAKDGRLAAEVGSLRHRSGLILRRWCVRARTVRR